jgi:Restriction endonuclease fold toxin 5
MLEAKGPGYANMMDASGQWQTWFTSYQAIENQMKNQSRAAGDRMVEWHFAEPEVANYFSKYAVNLNLENITPLSP